MTNDCIIRPYPGYTEADPGVPLWYVANSDGLYLHTDGTTSECAGLTTAAFTSVKRAEEAIRKISKHSYKLVAIHV